MKKLLGFLLVTMLAGCAATEPIGSGSRSAPATSMRTTGKDAYSITRRGTPVIGSLDDVKGEAFRDARRHCASKGKFLQANAIKTHPGGLDHGPEVTLEFSCLDPHRKTAPRARREPTPDGVIELGKP